MKSYRSIYSEESDNKEILIFDSAQEVRDYIEVKSKEYGGTNQYLSSEEYKNLYPQILYLFDIEKAIYKKKGIEAMSKAGISFGDRVEYVVASPWGYTEKYTGTVIDKKGIPYVKFDGNQKDMKGRKSSQWHKGWRKTK